MENQEPHGQAVAQATLNEKLAAWHEALGKAVEAKKLIEAEQALRKEVIALAFTEPKEGANTYSLAQGWSLKLTYKLDRKLDEAALPAVKEKLREMNVNPDPLIRYKPELDTKAYKTLLSVSAEAAAVFEQALTTKPGSHTLELVSPKEKK